MTPHIAHPRTRATDFDEPEHPRSLTRTQFLLERGGLDGLRQECRRLLKARIRAANRERVRCGGKRRSDGKPCQALSVPGKKRCRWHGGCSTGPKTPEGKARSLANLPTQQRRDCATPRTSKGPPTVPRARPGGSFDATGIRARARRTRD